MTAVPPEWTDLSPEWRAHVADIRQWVAGWRAQILDPPDPVEGSDLRADDDVFPPMPVSRLAWWGLSVAVEHLDAVIRLVDHQVESGGPILPTANFTTLRAALIGASQAVFLLVPEDRGIRTGRGLQLAQLEYDEVVRFRDSTRVPTDGHDFGDGEAGPPDRARHMRARRDVIRGKLQERQLRQRISDTAVIEEAAQLVYENATMRAGVSLEWRLGSGAAHGKILITLHRNGSHAVDADGTTALIGGSLQEISQQMANVAVMLSAGWRAWYVRAGG